MMQFAFYWEEVLIRRTLKRAAESLWVTFSAAGGRGVTADGYLTLIQPTRNDAQGTPASLCWGVRQDWHLENQAHPFSDCIIKGFFP